MERNLWIMTAIVLALLPSTVAAQAHDKIDFDLDVRSDLRVVARADARAHATFEWDWGDGRTGAGAEATHAYAKPGRYLVVLTVEDGEGGCWTEQRWVRVEASATQEKERESEREERERERAEREEARKERAERREREREEREKEREEEPEERERSKSRRSASAGASVSVGRGVQVDADVELGRHRASPPDSGATQARGSSQVYGDSHDRHNVPDVGLALALPGVAAAALALVRRR